MIMEIVLLQTLALAFQGGMELPVKLQFVMELQIVKMELAMHLIRKKYSFLKPNQIKPKYT